MLLLLIILLILFSIPWYPQPGQPTYTPYYGSWQPIGAIITIVIVILLVLLLFGRLHI